MGQDQSSALVVPARPLPGTSTLRDLCEVDYTVTYESSDDVGMVVNALKCLGFVLVKNVFEPHELAEIQPTVDAMIEACIQRAPEGSAWGNRGPNRMSANGFYENIESQAAGGTIFRNAKLNFILQKILGEQFFYGGTGVDVAFPNTVYQHLHSDDNGSNPYSDQQDVRQRWWPPAMVLAGPLLEKWMAKNGPMRIVPWNAVRSWEYQEFAKNGIPYNEEEERRFLFAYIEGDEGDLLIRDPRTLHGGTPNHGEAPRAMISMLGYSKEAVEDYPRIYRPKEVPQDQMSMPRFRPGSLGQEDNKKEFESQTKRYGEMRTLENDLDMDLA